MIFSLMKRIPISPRFSWCINLAASTSSKNVNLHSRNSNLGEVSIHVTFFFSTFLFLLRQPLHRGYRLHLSDRKASTQIGSDFKQILNDTKLTPRWMSTIHNLVFNYFLLGICVVLVWTSSSLVYKYLLWKKAVALYLRTCWVVIRY